MNLSVCVQHHPDRAHLLPLEQLDDYELVVDPEPDDRRTRSAFRTYLECLRRTPTDATHRLIVQDDAIPCTDFALRARSAIAERPDDLIAFFVPGRTVLTKLLTEAYDRGERWVQLPHYNWCPTVALCWPAHLAAEFVPYGDEVIATRVRRGLTTQADDPYVGAWVKKLRGEARRGRTPIREVWCTVPCLVQHPDVVESIFQPDTRARAGGNRARVAALYVDADGRAA